MITKTRGKRHAPKGELRTIHVYCCFCEEHVRDYETYNDYPSEDHGGMCEICAALQSSINRQLRAALKASLPELANNFVSELNGNRGER